jgi:hypothetical protein
MKSQLEGGTRGMVSDYAWPDMESSPNDPNRIPCQSPDRPPLSHSLPPLIAPPTTALASSPLAGCRSLAGADHAGPHLRHSLPEAASPRCHPRSWEALAAHLLVRRRGRHGSDSPTAAPLLVVPRRPQLDFSPEPLCSSPHDSVLTGRMATGRMGGKRPLLAGAFSLPNHQPATVAAPTGLQPPAEPRLAAVLLAGARVSVSWRAIFRRARLPASARVVAEGGRCTTAKPPGHLDAKASLPADTGGRRWRSCPLLPPSP